MKGWRIVKLGTLATFKNGLNFAGTSWGKGLKIIGVSDFKDRMFPDFATLDQINPQGVVRPKDLLDAGDIVFVRSNGNRELIGRCLYVKNLEEPVSHSGFTIRLRFEAKGICTPFYVYLFRSHLIRRALSDFGGGTNINNLNQDILAKLAVPLPGLATQQKIAAILSAYDDLIANNQRRIMLLERMAEDIYREWFVRLRFPGHEQVKSEKGVPQGWSPSTLGAVADFTMGQSPSSEYFNDAGNGLPFHQGVGSYGPRYPNHETFCSVSGRKAKCGDILFSVRAPVGRINIADRELIIGRGLAAIRHKRGMNGYLLYLLKVTFASEDMIGNGSIFNSVGKDELARLTVFQPSLAIVEKFEALVQPLDQRVAALYLANASLKATRDALLPRLISGKLAVDALDIRYPPGMANTA